MKLIPKPLLKKKKGIILKPKKVPKRFPLSTTQNKSWTDEEREEFILNSYTGKYNPANSRWSNFPYKPEMLRREVISSIERLEELAVRWRNVPVFAFDTETNTLRVASDNKDFRCVCITFSWGENDNYEIPLGYLREEDVEAGRNLDFQRVVEIIKPIFENPNVMLVGHNLKFDLHVLARIGILPVTKLMFDTMLSSWICDENTPNGLKENSAEKMGVPQQHFKEVTDSIPNEVKKRFGYKANSKVYDFGLVLIDDGEFYCIGDSFFTWCNFLGFRKEIIDEKMDKIYYHKMVPFLKVLFKMEEQGTTVDVETLKRMQKEMEEDIEKLSYAIIEKAGCVFNIGSSVQKSLLLYGLDDYELDFDIYLEKYKKKNAKRLAKSKNGLDVKEVQRKYLEKKNDKERLNILKHSFNFPVSSYTASNSPSTDSDAIWRISKKTYKNNRRKQEGADMCKLILEYSKLSKLKTAFADGILEQLYDDGKAHPSFNQCGTDSGRLSCIAEGTLVKVVGGDKPIEQIKKGDLVYCYDDKGVVRISKVLKTMNNGVRPCVDVTWKSTGIHEEGHLICTPDHKIRMTDGTWAEAQYLTEGDSVTHLRRSTDQRPRLYGLNSFCEQEQIVIKKQLFKCNNPNVCIHHEDEDKSNNDIDNLSLKYKPCHARLHSKKFAEEGKIKTEHLMDEKYRELHSHCGENNVNYIHTTVEDLERMVHEAKGIIRNIPMDFDTFKKKCAELNFDYKKVAGKYQKQYVTPGRKEFTDSFMKHKGKREPVMRELGIGRSKFDNLVREYDLCYNHKIINVTPCGSRHVYDLEVEEYHNFIAGEVCVHNCSSPNLQQLPKAEEDDKYQIRSVFIGSKYVRDAYTGEYVADLKDYLDHFGFVDEDYEIDRKKIIAIDYHNLEMVCLTHFSHDKNLTEMFANDDDAHGSTAVNMFNLDCTPVECKKKYPHLRQVSKTLNFLLMYGGGAKLLYENLKADHYAPLDLGGEEFLKQYSCRTGEEVAQCIIDKYFTTYSGVAQFIAKQKKFAHKNGYVRTILGRKRRLPDINSRDMKKSSYCERLSVNSAIQGTAGDITISAQLRIDSEERLKELGCNMLIQVHDELVFECPEENLEEAIEIIKYDMEHPFGDTEDRMVKYLRADYDFGSSYQEAK